MRVSQRVCDFPRGLRLQKNERQKFSLDEDRTDDIISATKEGLNTGRTTYTRNQISQGAQVSISLVDMDTSS